MTQLPMFGGATYSASRDGERLDAQLLRVRVYVSDSQWHTLGEISEALGYPEASVSARLRDLRKDKFGGYTVERRYVRRGLHEYKVARP